jgi:hypothetical protein
MSEDITSIEPETTAGPWQMWAGQRLNHGETEPVFADVSAHPMYTKAHGHGNPIRVVVTEDPTGRYWGWLSNLNRDRSETPVYDDSPTMIYEHEGIFDMCHPYGYKAEVEANAGRVVRLSITAADAADEPTTEAT